jgi:DNA polymerase alpha subunit B
VESLCKIYNLTPNELNTKWEAFALTHQCDMKPTVSYIKILKNSLQREFDRSLKSRRTVKGRVTTKRAGAVGGGIDLSEYGIDMSTDENIGDNSVDNL